MARLVKLIERGRLRPMLARTFPLRELAKAQEVFLATRHIGNIVVTMED
jgi:NADPH:quinone reductase-like Zn-dependent oxidoreductase